MTEVRLLVDAPNRFQLNVKNFILNCALLLILTLSAHAQKAQFLPRQIAVLRAGDGSISLRLKQARIFVDQFDPTINNASPSFTVAIPTNGPNAFFFNGHAATEGNLTRSVDKSLLVFTGYGTSLFLSNGTPSTLDIPRGFCTIDAAGAARTTTYVGTSWSGKMNPRGIATDGTNNFWGCGSAYGTLYFNSSNTLTPVQFSDIESTRAVRIINNVLYTTINHADGVPVDKPAGIYRFVAASGTAAPLPRDASVSLDVVVPAPPSAKGTVGFDIDPTGSIAYMADTAAGIQKFIKSGGTWKLAYTFAIPQNIPSAEKHAAGCFGLVTDFSGPAPIIYATTTEGYNGSVNSNRVIRIVDTNANATIATIAQAGSTNVAFRGIDFTPEVRSGAALRAEK
jgi:hypothetical protein